MSVMLYKHPGQHKLHGDMFDYIIVNEDAVEDTIKKGWSLTTDEAKGIMDAEIIDNAPPTREEIEAKATELGIKFRSNTTDETILSKIKEVIDGLD